MDFKGVINERGILLSMQPEGMQRKKRNRFFSNGNFIQLSM